MFAEGPRSGRAVRRPGLAAAALALGCATDSDPTEGPGVDRRFVLAYQNNVGGDIEPCG